jgi:hypothetical protein
VRLEGLCQLKNSNDTIGNRTRDLPACSAVSQPTASLRASLLHVPATLNMNPSFDYSKSESLTASQCTYFKIK